MRCIIVDDEPIARKGIQKLVARISQLELLDSFNSAEAAAGYMQITNVDLIRRISQLEKIIFGKEEQ